MAEAIAINTDIIKQRLDTLKGARMKMWLDICAHCGLCAESCFFYQAHNKDPKMVPSYKIKKTIWELYKRKGNVDKEFMEQVYEIVFAECTACRRCSMYCPFGIDMATMIAATRAICRSQNLTPEGLQKAIENIWKTGNQMGMTEEEFVETCQWMEEENQAELPGLKVPVDKQGADMMYTVNAREPMFYPQDIGMAATIFHVAGEDWTMPSTGWDCTNLAMFAGDAKCMAHAVKLVYDAAKKLGVKRIGVTECGHAYRSLRFEGPYWLGLPGGQPPIPVIHSVQLFSEYLRDGRIKVDPAKKLKEPVTYQDPCNISRNGGLCDEARYIIGHIATDFREMQPNREHNYCCGGGGGYIPMGPPFKKRRMASGKVKAEQIRATGAKIAIVPCHNCYDQIKDLNKEYNLGIEVKAFKEILTEIMTIPDELKAKETEAA